MIDLLLLSKDAPIARIINGVVEPILPERLPLFLKRTGDATAWLASRAIDGHRTNSRLLKKALRLEHKDDLTTVLAVNAATITDNYWVKPISDEAVRYADVRFNVNKFDKLALTGDVNSFDQPPSRTPELTNTGSFEKCWRVTGGAWRMIKSGKPEELFSEMFAYEIGKVLGFPMAHYAAEDGFISSRDFTDSARVDFEPAVGIIGDESDYFAIYTALKKLDKAIAEQYVSMCYFDGLIYNMDRHENNFGVLRDADTGQILSLAPFYDHNISLVSRGYPGRMASRRVFESGGLWPDSSADQPEREPADRLITDFAEFVSRAGITFSARRLYETQLIAAARGIPFEPPATDAVPDPRKFTAGYVVKRQTVLEERCGERLRLPPVSTTEEIRAAEKAKRDRPPLSRVDSKHRNDIER